jgi:hypothetical protein
LDALGTERARSIALRPRRFGQRALARKLRCGCFLVFLAGQRCKECHQVVDLVFVKRERLDVFVQPRIRYAISFVVVIHDVPQ